MSLVSLLSSHEPTELRFQVLVLEWAGLSGDPFLQSCVH